MKFCEKIIMLKEKPVKPQLNIFGNKIIPCSFNPITGFFRDGCCNTDQTDQGSHTVCAEMTELFLSYSKSKGNDLSTPRPEFGFKGLSSGDSWCLCASRWLQAEKDGVAPLVFGKSTNYLALSIIPESLLKKYLITVN